MKHIIIVAIVAVPLAAVAGAKDRAVKVHMAKAAKAHKDGKFELALTELEAAYGLDPKPDLQYAIGQIYVKLGRCGEARIAYDRFVAVHHEASQAVAQALAACVDAAPPPPASEPAPAPVVDEKPAAPIVVPPPHEDTPFTPAPRVSYTTRPWYTDKLGDALVVSGLVAGAIGIFEYRRATTTLDDAEAAGDLAMYKRLVGDAHSERTYSVVLIGGGCALVGAGLLHYMFHDRGTESQPVGLAPTSGGGVVTWGGHF